MAFTASSSVMQKCQQAGASGSEFDVRQVWSGFQNQKRNEPNQSRAKYCSKQQEKIAAGEEVRMYQNR